MNPPQARPTIRPLCTLLVSLIAAFAFPALAAPVPAFPPPEAAVLTNAQAPPGDQAGQNGQALEPEAPTSGLAASTSAPITATTAKPTRATPASKELLPLGPPPAGNNSPKAAAAGEGQTAKSPFAEAVSAFWPLAVVVALILGAAYFVRKLAKGDPGLVAALGAGGKAPAGVLEVLARYPVSRTGSFVLLRLDRRILLLNQSFGKAGAGFSTLADITDPEEVASILIRINQGESKSMHSYLDSAMKQMEQHEHEPRAAAPSAQPPLDTVHVSFPPAPSFGGLRRPHNPTGGAA